MNLILTVPLLTTNRERNGHFRERAAHVKLVREAAFWSVKEAKMLQMDCVEVSCRPGQANGRLADAGAHLPTAKAALDGIVDAGILEDDSPKYVTALIMYAPVRTEKDQIIITLTPSDSGVQ